MLTKFNFFKTKAPNREKITLNSPEHLEKQVTHPDKENIAQKLWKRQKIKAHKSKKMTMGVNLHPQKFKKGKYFKDLKGEDISFACQDRLPK